MGALDINNELTWLGEMYSELPCDIKFTRLILFGLIFNCMKDCLRISAILS